MWAQQLVAPFRFEDVTIPEPAEQELASGEVILQMRAGAICGSDLPIFRGGIPPNPYKSDVAVDAQEIRPGLPMHEVIGDVIASNSELQVGQRVVGWARHNNGLCEKIVAEARSLHALDDDGFVPTEQVIIQPLACVLHALSRLPGIEGRRVAVIGQGPIGLLFSHALRSAGASHVAGIDVIDRSDVAADFGMDDCVHLSSDQWARDVTDADRPEIVIEAVGHQVGTVNHAIEAAAPEARIFCFGIADDPTYPVDMKKIQRKELTLMSGTTPFAYRRDALARAAAYIRDHPALAKTYPTNVFSTEEIQLAYECADLPARGRMKVAIKW